MTPTEDDLRDAEAWLADVTKEDAKRVIKFIPFLQRYFESLLPRDGEPWRTSTFVIDGVARQMSVDSQSFVQTESAVAS